MDNNPDEKLLSHIKSNLKEIIELHKDFTSFEEDFVYRFYHQSFKVFGSVNLIKEAKSLFDRISPEGWHLNDWYCQIIDEALNKKFNSRTNSIWLTETRPILEAFWHSKYFLDQMSRYGSDLDNAPQMLPSGWATVLYLYKIR